MHDVRSSATKDEASQETTEETKTEHQSRADIVDKWSHDLYNEQRQQPKSERELNTRYGYNIREKQDGDNQQSTPNQNNRPRRSNPNYRNRRGQNNRQTSNRQESNNENERRDDNNRPYRENNFSSTRGRGRTFFKRTFVPSRQNYNADDQQNERPPQRPFTKRQPGDASHRNYNQQRASNEFQNLNGAQALPKREPRNAPRDQNREQHNRRGPPSRGHQSNVEDENQPEVARNQGLPRRRRPLNIRAPPRQ